MQREACSLAHVPLVVRCDNATVPNAAVSICQLWAVGRPDGVQHAKNLRTTTAADEAMWCEVSMRGACCADADD